MQLTCSVGNQWKRVRIDFIFTCDWMTKSCDFYPASRLLCVAERGEAKAREIVPYRLASPVDPSLVASPLFLPLHKGVVWGGNTKQRKCELPVITSFQLLRPLKEPWQGRLIIYNSNSWYEIGMID